MRRYGESPAHENQKERVGRILSAQGWTVWVDSYPFKCETAKGERTYWPDVYAESPEYTAWYNDNIRRQGVSVLQSEPDSRTLCFTRPGRASVDRNGEGIQGRGKRIIVEIQGFKGHNSRFSKGHDANRISDIWACYGYDIAYYPLHLWALKGASDQDIREEIGL